MSKAVYKKLLEVKKQVPYLQKDKEGHNYKYVTPSEVLGKVNPLLNEQGLLLVTNVIKSESQPITIHTKYGDKVEWKFDLELLMQWVDTETGETVDIQWKASGVNGEEKGLGSALTYAERYFILKQLNIPTDNDDPDSFQNRMMTDEDRKKKKEEDETRFKAEVKAATESLKKCKTVEELKAVKSNLSANIISTPDFKKAANATYELLSAPVEDKATIKWKSLLDKCKTTEQLEALWKGSATEVGKLPWLKEMFTARKDVINHSQVPA